MTIAIACICGGIVEIPAAIVLFILSLLGIKFGAKRLKHDNHHCDNC